MPNVAMPNGDVVAFPDDMPREKIKGLISSKFPDVAKATPAAPTNPPVDSTTDVALSMGSNLLKGGVDVAMILPNMLNAAVAGPQYLYEGVVGEDRKDFKPWQPFYSSEDVVKDSMIDYQPQTKGGKFAEFPTRLIGNVVAPSLINKGVNKVLPKEKVSAADKLTQSNAKYDAVEKSGMTTGDGVIDDFIAKAQKIRPPGRVAQATGARDAFDDALEEVSKVGQLKNLSIKEVKDLDSRLTALAEGARNGGASTTESRLINKMKYLWRETIEESANAGKIRGKQSDVKAWQGAVKDYSSSKRANDIELIIERAKLTDNPAISAKTGFRNLYLKIKQGKARGYTPEQVKEIKRAAEQGITTGIARVMGSNLNPIIALSSTGLDAGIVAGAASKASRSIATSNQLGRAGKALQSVTGGGTRAVNPVNEAWAARNIGDAMKAAAPNAALQSMPERNALQIPSRTEQGMAPQNYQPSAPVELKRSDTVKMEPMSYNTTDSFLDDVKQAESSGDPNARPIDPKTGELLSTASGHYQFIDRTWRDSVAKWGKKHGVRLEDKNKPEAQEKMVRELAADNARILTNKLDTKPTKADMYAAHFMGAPQAVRLIKMKNSRAIAAKVFPTEAKSNREIFFEDGKPRTVAEVYQFLAKKVS